MVMCLLCKCDSCVYAHYRDKSQDVDGARNGQLVSSVSITDGYTKNFSM